LADPRLAPFTRAEFAQGQPLADYVTTLPAAQPDFPELLAQCQLEPAAVERIDASAARFGAIITEPWCLDSLHALPVLVRMQEALPALDLRTWQRSADPDLALRIAGGHPGGALPAVPHVAFYDADFQPLGHFLERPASLSAWLDEESRHFRTRLRMTERDRVRHETMDGLLAAAEVRPMAPLATGGRPLTVYEQWVATDPTRRGELEDALRRHLPALQAVPGVRSVDFAVVDDTGGRYLALFRYEDETVRDRFLGSDAVKRMRVEVDPLWTRVTDTTWSYGL
jgi:quinol monooxygenase YgiN